MGRKPNGASSIYLGQDGSWHGRVTVGVLDDGRPDRRHVRGKTESIVIKKVRELERKRDAGTMAKAGDRWTVKSWLIHWLDNVAAPNVRENTLSAYRVAVNKHLIPGLGAHKLDRLTPEHLERFYAKMQTNGSKPATAHQAHRTMRAALNEAVRRGHLSRNPAQLARAPKLAEAEIEPYSLDEVRKLLAVASKRRNSARWAVALALGLRQGEALGLRWDDVDLDNATLWIRRSRQRPTYDHGCGGSCGRSPGYCPKRITTRADTSDTKSRAGRRRIGLPTELVDLLRQHQAVQDQEREAAAQLWQDGGWVFASPVGTPVIPNTDYHEWKHLLKIAGLRDGRLHDARHTAATVLLILGVSERAAMGVMGWASTSMAARYQHVTDVVRQDIAKRVGGLIWEPPSDPSEGEDGGADDEQDQTEAA